MPADLFTRGGAPAPSGTRGLTNRGRPAVWISRACARCGGAGASDRWIHTGRVCFDCNGSGKSPHGNALVALFTGEELARLNDTAAKRRATLAAKQAAAEADLAAAAATRRAAFEAEHAEPLAYLRARNAVALEAAGYSEGYAEGFIGDLLRAADRRAEWSPAQAEAVRESMRRHLEREAQKAASRHVGAIGERLRLPVTVERVSSFQREAFKFAGREETVWVVAMRDESGNALVSKSPSFRPEEGERIELRATVKAHEIRLGEAQTIVARAVSESAAAERRAEAKRHRKAVADGTRADAALRAMVPAFRIFEAVGASIPRGAGDGACLISSVPGNGIILAGILAAGEAWALVPNKAGGLFGHAAMLEPVAFGSWSDCVRAAMARWPSGEWGEA